MMALWDEGTAADWEAARRHYWDLIPAKKLPLEREMNALPAARVEAMDGETFCRFLYEQYFPWKYTAPNRLATTRAHLRGHLEDLPGLTRIHDALFSFPREDIRQGLETAKKIHGLGVAGASGLLAILFPRDFGTVDQFVVKALRSADSAPLRDRLERMKPECLRIQDGAFLVQLLRDKAAELARLQPAAQWTPRAVDMALWAYERTR